MATYQLTLSKERGAQWARYVQTRPELHGLETTEAIHRVLFETVDATTPMKVESP